MPLHPLLRRATTLVAALAVGVPTAAAATATSAQADVRDVPDGAPAAAQRPEPGMRNPDGWPLAQRLSRTAGTGRLHGGGSYWTDFVYDDHGAALPGGLTLDNTAALAPEQGVYDYPDGPARNNGADVFVAATGVDRHASYWRVDWNTLADPDVPLAVWALDTDGKASTGTDTWPAQSGLTSPGLDRALVVSGQGAWLRDLRTGRVRDVTKVRGGRLTIDRQARSFVVRVPRRLLPVGGRWRVRLATGLASEDGRTMATPTAGGQPVEGAARAYNVAFRTVRQEKPIVRDGQTAALAAAAEKALAGSPLVKQLGADGQARFVTGNFWNEDAQADALATGDVSRFSRVVDWRRLARKDATREPLVRGSSVRWYRSRLHLGQGVVEDEGGGTGDGRPNYLGRIQPYSVYVPTSYRRGDRLPLTWTLHSLAVNHQQYAAYDPQLIQRLCEKRRTICASTLGHGPDGWYFDEAEVDYWSVWRSVARAFDLRERKTVITGYSMGGWAAYHLGLAHPDLYAEAVALAGPPQCGVSLDGDRLVAPAFGGRCTSDGTSFDLIGNAEWLPFRIGQGQLDQLVPFTSVEKQVSRFDQRGLRHRFVRYPGEDHLVFAVQDRFKAVLEGLGHPTAPARPRDVDYTWRPRLSRPGLGIGATTAYWLESLAARDHSPGSRARVRASSFALPGREHGTRRLGPEPIARPLPAVRTELRWTPGRRQVRFQRGVLRLENVERVAVDMRRAGLRCGARLRVRTDGPTRLVLRRLGGGTQVRRLGAGDRVIRARC